MRLEIHTRVMELIEAALRRRVYPGPTPDWLYRPGRKEIGPSWRIVRLIYRRLTDGMELPDVMPFRESRAIDGIIGGRGRPPRIVEVDESQHFNEFRHLTLRLYPPGAQLAFPRNEWMRQSSLRRATGGGGWGRPKPPLFPMPGGRHRQRAFRDVLADLLPPLNGYAPTLRIAEFEVLPWIYGPTPVAQMRRLLDERITLRAEG